VGRPAVACRVPGCQGRVERGKHPDGSTQEWCTVCERRLLQLHALQERLATAPPAPSIGEVDDARLATLIQERCVNLTQSAKATRRSMNLIRAAIASKEIPAAMIGRYAVVPEAAVIAWGKAYRRRHTMQERAQLNLYALPRQVAKAVTLVQWSKLVQKDKNTLSACARAHAKDPRLQVCAILSPKRRPMLAYWWNEPQDGARV